MKGYTNYYVVLIIVLLQLLFVIEIKAVVTEVEGYPHIKDQDTTNVNNCKFVFKFLANSNSLEVDDVVMGSADINVGIVIIADIVKTQSHETAFTTTLNFVKIGTYSQTTIKVKYVGGFEENYQINTFTCLSIDSSKLKVSVIGEVTFDKLLMKPTGVIKVEGLNQSIPSLGISGGISTPVNTSNINLVYYYISFHTRALSPIINDHWSFTIDFISSPSISVSFKTKIVTDTPNSIQVYPPTMPIKQIGYFTSPILMISGPIRTNLLYIIASQTFYTLFPISNGPLINDSTTIKYMATTLTSSDISTTSPVLIVKTLSINRVDSNSLTKLLLTNISYNEFQLIATSPAASNTFVFMGDMGNMKLDIKNMSHCPSKLSHALPNSSQYNLNIESPFGYTKGNLNQFTFEATVVSKQKYLASVINIELETIKQLFSTNPLDTPDLKPPALIDYSFQLLVDNYVSLSFTFTDDVSGLEKIRIDGTFYYLENLIGTTINGSYSVTFKANILSPSIMGYLELYDVVGRSSIFSNGSLFEDTSNGKIKMFQVPTVYSNFEVHDIESVSFKYNYIDTSSASYWNSVTVKLVNAQKNTLQSSLAISFYFFNGIGFGAADIVIYLYWDNSAGEWNGEFKVPANLIPGQVFYFLSTNDIFISSEALKPTDQLIVYSMNPDVLGPLFSLIVKIDPEVIDGTIIFGWTLEITDQVNGFSNGYVVIRGSIDNSIYNYTLDITKMIRGDIYIGNYSIEIIVNNNSRSQDYTITDVVLVDNQGHTSTFKDVELKIPTERLAQCNPFINYLSDSLINRISVTTGNNFPADYPDMPQISYLKQTQLPINQGTNRLLEYEFQVNDLYEFKIGQDPILYFTSSSFQVLKTFAILKSETVIGGYVTRTYTAKIKIPFEFGFGDDILISIYNLVNIIGNFNGYSTVQLLNGGVVDFVYKVPKLLTIDTPIIKNVIAKSEKIANLNGYQITLLGIGLNGTSKINIDRDDGGSSLVIISFLSSSSNFIKFIYPLNITTIYITAETTGILSNVYEYHEIVPNFIVPPMIVTPSPSSTPSSTPVITNAPQTCLGNPQCGGPTKGTCMNNIGCVCFSPYIGLDCSSQIISVPPPKVNPDKPITVIKVPTDSNGNNITNIISIVGIREMDGISNTQVNYYKFDNWVYSNLLSVSSSLNISQYTHTIQYPNSNTTTLVNVTMEWFINQTNISFAGEPLTMNPSSMKYTIHLSSYSFKSKLNTLQIIMSAQIQSTTTDTQCSNKEFGNTTTDNSNYIKLQVGKNSFYGRYIKRGIVDDKIQLVSNVLLDDELESLNELESNERLSHSFIGIQIGYFSKSVVIDPDFSVIVDSNPVDTNSINSICSPSVSNSLTTPQLAGIIVGSVCFFIVLLIIGAKIIYSSSKCLPLKIFFYRLLNKKKY